MAFEMAESLRNVMAKRHAMVANCRSSKHSREDDRDQELVKGLIDHAHKAAAETMEPDASNSNSSNNSNSNRVDVHDHVAEAVQMVLVLETRAKTNWTKNWINTWPNQDPAIWMACSIEGDGPTIEQLTGEEAGEEVAILRNF